MKILITGNMGYIGPSVVSHLRKTYPEAQLVGLDMGYFANCLTNEKFLPECKVDVQYFADVRRLKNEHLKNIDAVIHLAAISNDPMGNTFENVTYDVNHRASVNLAQKAKEAGATCLVFASSCSMYGAAEEEARDESSPLNPLTAYAKSKVYTEQDLKGFAGDGFQVTSLRFSTACGMSDRLRLDLVLNDFVAGAVASGKITILSDGTPWRPLIHVRDMARAIEWAISRDASAEGDFLAVNVGCNEWNFQVKDLAYAVAKVIPDVEVSINPDAQPDKRSYQVDFSRYKKLAPDHQPQVELSAAIEELRDGLQSMGFKDGNFRDSQFMRLKVLTYLRETDQLTETLQWA
jgi:nucleoside-diphosphate-sugar epimerase